MSNLSKLRNDIKALLMEDGLWAASDIIVKRRTKIWNDVAVAIGANKSGQCIAIGVPKGDPSPRQSGASKTIQMDLTIAVSLIETPEVDPDADDDEDGRWEQTAVRLQGDPLSKGPCIKGLNFAGFDEVAHPQFLIRQMLFKVRLNLTPENTTPTTP